MVSDCCQPCATVPPVNVPGAPGNDGAPGAPGTPGVNAFTIVTTGFIIPALMNNVTVDVANTSWMTIGQVLVIQGPANFRVMSIPSTTSVVLQFLSNPGDLPSGSAIGANATVSASGFGESAFTFTTADFTIPPIGNTVTVNVIQSDWMAAGISIYIAGDWFTVSSIPSLTSVILTYANVVSNVNAGNTVTSGAKMITSGHNGENAYTLTIAADQVIPALASNVTVNVANSDWMVVGSNVVIGDASWGKATYQVVSLPTSQSATLTFLGYPADAAPGVTMTTGSRVSVCGVLIPIETHSGIGTGVDFDLTITQQILALSGSQPTITLGGPGTYALYACAQYRYTNSYHGHNPPATVTTAIHRFNNTPAFLALAQTVWTATDQDLSAAQSRTAIYAVLPCIIYTTTTLGDVLELWGWFSGLIDAGNISATEASIVAIKLSM